MKAVKAVLYGLVGAFFVFASSGVSAQEPPDTRGNMLLEEFKKRGGQVDYLGHALGLDGWVVMNPENGSVQYVYTSPEGGTIIGMLFAPNGDMVTKDQLEAYLARKDGSQAHITGAELSSASKAEKAYADIAVRANWVHTGNKDAPYLYAFINTHCEHCQAFLKQILPHVKNGKLSLRLVPYGTSPENALGAALLLSQEDPLPALEQLAAGDRTVFGEANAQNVKVGAAGRVQVNNYFAERYVRGALPFIIYRKLGNGELSAVAGMPENLMSLLADLTPVEKVTETLSEEEKNATAKEPTP